MLSQKPVSHKTFLIGVLVAGILSGTAWGLILTRMNPFSSTSLALALFYITFFFCSAAAFTLLGYVVRIIMYHREVYFVHLNLTLRQGVLLAGLTTLMLVFQSFRVVTWWNSVLLVVAIILLEFYFISSGRRW